MKYITITSKHHDGFAMFDSRLSDWNVVARSPYGKDVTASLVKAFRDWVFEEVGRFKQLFDRACQAGPAASGDLTAGASRAMP